MESIKRTVSPSFFVVVIAVLCVIVAYQAGAARLSPSKPAVVATVDLPKVLDGLDQRGKAEADLMRMYKSFEEERERRSKSMEQGAHRLNDMGERHRAGEISIKELQAFADEVDREMVNNEAWRRHMLEKFDIEQSLLMQELYRGIKKAVRDMAEAEGYDLVIFDSSGGELRINPDSRASRTEQVQQQILARGVLYTGGSLDITNDLIERMNNHFHAGAR